MCYPRAQQPKSEELILLAFDGDGSEVRDEHLLIQFVAACFIFFLNYLLLRLEDSVVGCGEFRFNEKQILAASDNNIWFRTFLRYSLEFRSRSFQE
jgi:hypothetical protein